MRATILQGLALVLQLATAGLILRRLQRLQQPTACVFLATAIALMAWQYGMRLLQQLSGEISRPFTLPTTVLSLALSLCLVAGIAYTSRLLHARERSTRKQAEEALAARIQQLEAIRAVAVEMTQELNLPRLLSLIMRHAVELVEMAREGGVYLWDEETQLLIPQAQHGLSTLTELRPRQLGEGVVGAVAQRREGLLSNNYQQSLYAIAAILQSSKCTAGASGSSRPGKDTAALFVLRYPGTNGKHRPPRRCPMCAIRKAGPCSSHALLFPSLPFGGEGGHDLDSAVVVL